MVIASGPYTLDGNLDYEPLHALLAFCSETKPDVLLLMGPFVDAEHPSIAENLAAQPFHQIYQESVGGRPLISNFICCKILSELGLRHGPAYQVMAAVKSVQGLGSVAVIPSLRDAQQLPVFPQPAMSAKAEGGTSYLGNPATFKCSGITFGVVTADILRHLSSQEIQKGHSSSDRMTALASHILWQHRQACIWTTKFQPCWVLRRL